jgi:hypothetical protein
MYQALSFEEVNTHNLCKQFAYLSLLMRFIGFRPQVHHPATFKLQPRGAMYDHAAISDILQRWYLTFVCFPRVTTQGCQTKCSVFLEFATIIVAYMLPSQLLCTAYRTTNSRE